MKSRTGILLSHSSPSLITFWSLGLSFSISASRAALSFSISASSSLILASVLSVSVLASFTAFSLSLMTPSRSKAGSADFAGGALFAAFSSSFSASLSCPVVFCIKAVAIVLNTLGPSRPAITTPLTAILPATTMGNAAIETTVSAASFAASFTPVMIFDLVSRPLRLWATCATFPEAWLIVSRTSESVSAPNKTSATALSISRYAASAFLACTAILRYLMASGTIS